MANAPIIHIHKPEQHVDAVRIRKWVDIPDFLIGSIKIDPTNNEIILNCYAESAERAPLGAIVGYAQSKKAATGWDTWHIEDLSHIEERNGEFFTKADILEAQEVTDEAPEILRGANIWRGDDGSWIHRTGWGTETVWPGQAYWVKYGVDEKGKPKGHVLTKGGEAFNLFIVCNDAGRDICSLSDWDSHA